MSSIDGSIFYDNNVQRLINQKQNTNLFEYNINLVNIMDRNQLSQKIEIKQITNLCLLLGKIKGFDCSPYLQEARQYQLNRINKIYYHHLTNFGQEIADQQLQQYLISTKNVSNWSNYGQSMTQEQMGIQTRCVQEQIKHELLQQNQAIIIKKDREVENDGKINYQQREARSNFFINQIRNKLKEVNVDNKQQKGIIQLFINARYSQNSQQLNIDLGNLGKLKKYRNKIEQLKRSLQSIHKQFVNKKRECLPMLLIIQKKITTLKVINIEYKQKIGHNKPYSISSYQFFKVVHENRLLTEATVKGVLVQNLKSFIKQLKTAINSKGTKQQNQKINWIKNFNPSKILKLAIDSNLQFDINHKEEIVSQINTLIFFIKFFYQLSDISATIKLSPWEKIYDSVSILQDLWKCLRTIRRLKIIIIGELSYIPKQSVSAVRSVLFGGLACFTEIAQLAIIHIYFRTFAVQTNEYIAMEQIIRTIFQNNNITHLKLHNCRNFPTVSNISTLQSIDLSYISFWTIFSLMSEILVILLFEIAMIQQKIVY